MTCVGHATFYFGAKVSQIYADHYHAYQIKGATTVMIEGLREAFSEQIQFADWMDDGNMEIIQHSFL